MDKKFFVPFETAKALKEKGYNEQCSYYYGDCVIRMVPQCPCTNEQLSDYAPNWLFNECISAPTYHEVVDWLDGKGIYITCNAPLVKQNMGQYIAGVFNSNTNDWGVCRGVYPTREEALNVSILKALEML